MSYKCGNPICANTESSLEWINCVGICGKFFHPSCVGLGKRPLAYLKDFKKNFLFYCDECRDISLSHVMLAIKCLSDQTANSHTECVNNINNLSKKFDIVLKSVDELHQQCQLNTSECHSKFLEVDKRLTSINKSSESVNDSLALLNNSLSTNLNSLKSDLELHFQSNSSKTISPVSPPDQPLPIQIYDDLFSMKSMLSRVSAELISIGYDVTSNGQRTIEIQRDMTRLNNNSRELRLQIYDMIDESKNPTPDTVMVYNNLSVSDEMLCSETDNDPPASLTQIAVQPQIKPTAPSSPPNDLPVSPPKDLPVSSPTIIKFGHRWTLSDWNKRLSKLESANNTHFCLKNTPYFANKSWISTYFGQRFSIFPTVCHQVSPKCFKIQFPSKYNWIFYKPYGLQLDNMMLFKWKNLTKPNSYFQNKSKPSLKHKSPQFPDNPSIKRVHVNFNKTTYRPTNKPVNFPRPDPNWSFKTKLFPSFNHPSLQQKLPSVPTPSKPQARRVSFNLTPTTFPPQPPTPTPNSIPHFDLSSGAKYPNFNSSHILNPSPASLSNNNNAPSQINSSPNTFSTTSHVLPPSPPNFVSSLPMPTQSFIDPLLPPTVKLTQQTVDSTESRYALSRLRDKKTYENTRIFLAYLHDKSDSVCYEGKTKTSVMISIQQEGLPIDVNSLKNLYIRYHEFFNMSPQKVENDLDAFGKYIHSKRISYLQRSRADHDRFFRS